MSESEEEEYEVEGIKDYRSEGKWIRVVRGSIFKRT